MSVDTWFRTYCGCGGGCTTADDADVSSEALRALRTALVADGSDASDSKLGDVVSPAVTAFFAHSDHGGACHADQVLGRVVSTANHAGGDESESAANATRLTALEVLAALARTNDSRHLAGVVAAMGSFGPKFERAMEEADEETTASYHRLMLLLLTCALCHDGAGQSPQDVLELTNGDTAAAVRAMGAVVEDVSGDLTLTLACFNTLLGFADMDRFLLEHKVSRRHWRAVAGGTHTTPCWCCRMRSSKLEQNRLTTSVSGWGWSCGL